MPGNDLKLSLLIDAETKGLQGKLDGLIGALGSFSTAALAAGGLYGYAESIEAAVRAFSELQDSMALIDTLDVVDDLGGLKRELIDISLKVPVAATELAAATYQALSAGMASAQAAEAARIAALAARAGMSDTTTAVDGMTTAMNVWGDSIGSASSAMDKYLTAQNLGKTTLAEMASSIGGVAATAKSLNVSFDELLASNSSLTLGGIATSEAMTGLKAVFSNILKPSKDASDMAKTLGIDFSVASVQSKGWSGWVNELAKKLSDYEENGGNATDANAKLFGSTEALNVMLNLTSEQGLSRFNSMTEKIGDSMGATNAMAAKVNDTWSGFSQLFQNHVFAALEAVGEVIVKTVMPAGRDLFEIIDNLSAALTPVLDLLGPILKYTLLTATGILRELTDVIRSLLSPFAMLRDEVDWTSEKFDEYIKTLERLKTANIELVAQQSGLYQKLMLDAETAAGKIIAEQKLTGEAAEAAMRKELALAEQRYNQYLEVIVANQQLMNDADSMSEKYRQFSTLLQGSYEKLGELPDVAPKVKIDIQSALDQIGELQHQFETASATGNKLEMLIALKDLEKAKSGLDELIAAAGQVPVSKTTAVAVAGKDKMMNDLAELELKIGNAATSKLSIPAEVDVDPSRVDAVFAELGEEIRKKKEAIERDYILTPSADNAAALAKITEIESEYATLKTGIEGTRIALPDLPTPNLDLRLPDIKADAAAYIADLKPVAEAATDIKVELGSWGSAIADAGDALHDGLETQMQNLFSGGRFDFSKLLSGVQGALFEPLAGKFADLVVGENGNGGLLGTLTGALGIAGPWGAAIGAGVSFLGSALSGIFGGTRSQPPPWSEVFAEQIRESSETIKTEFTAAVRGSFSDIADEVQTLLAGDSGVSAAIAFSLSTLGDDLNAFFSGIDIGDYMEIATGIVGDATLAGLEDQLAALRAELTMLSESGMEFGWQGYATEQAITLYNQIDAVERKINQVYGTGGVWDNLSFSVAEGVRAGIDEWETTWGYIIEYNRDMLEASGVDINAAMAWIHTQAQTMAADAQSRIDAFMESLRYLPIDDWDNAWQAFSGVFSAEMTDMFTQWADLDGIIAAIGVTTSETGAETVAATREMSSGISDALNEAESSTRDYAAAIEEAIDGLSAEDQIAELRRMAAANDAYYGALYGQIDAAADMIEALMRSQVEMQLAGIEQVISRLTERYELEMTLIRNNNSELEAGLSAYFAAIGDMAGATAEEAAEIARRYNEEQLENLASVNAANQKIIEYKLQGANLTEQERRDVEIFLAGLSSVTDEQTKQNLLLEFAQAMREKGIEINLQDYQTLLLKQDLTAEEIEALQEKRALGEEALRDMKEDLDIQRQRLIDAGLPTLEVERMLALEKQRQLAAIAASLGFSIDELSVLDTQLIRTAEIEAQNKELALTQLDRLQAELAAMEQTGATQAEINEYRLQSLAAIAESLGIEQSQLENLLSKNQDIAAEEAAKKQMLEDQLQALLGVRDSTDRIADGMTDLAAAMSQLAAAIAGDVNPALSESASLTDRMKSDLEDLNDLQFDRLRDKLDVVMSNTRRQLDDVKAGLDDIGAGAGLSDSAPDPEASFAVGSPFIPRNMLAQVHAGEAVLPSDLNARLRAFGVNSLRDYAAIPDMFSALALGGGAAVGGAAPVINLSVSGNTFRNHSDIDYLVDQVSERLAENILHRGAL